MKTISILTIIALSAIFIWKSHSYSFLIMKIQKRMSTNEGLEKMCNYVGEHSDIMQFSAGKMQDSIKLVFRLDGIYRAGWLKINSNYNEKKELKKLYEAIK